MLHRCCVPNAHNKTIYHRNPSESCSAPQKKATSKIDVAFTKSGDFKMPIQHCQSNTANVSVRRSRRPYEWNVQYILDDRLTRQEFLPQGSVAQSYSCRTKNMINKVSKHALTIPVYSPLQELCFVRTAISSSPRMEWSMRGCLRRGRLQITYRLQAPRSNRANHLIPQTLLNALR